MKTKLTRTMKASLAAVAISGIGSALAADNPVPTGKELPASAPAGITPDAKPVDNPQSPALPIPSAPQNPRPTAKVDANGQIQGQVQGSTNAENAQPKRQNDRQDATPHQTNRAYSSDSNAARAGANANINARNRRGDVGLTFGANTDGGLQISSIGANGYFGNVGFQQGDQIISAGGQRFNDQNAFYGWLGSVQVGQRVPIIVNRGGQQQTVYWTPTQEFVQQYSQAAPATGQSLLGIYLDERQQDAVIVAEVEPNSPAHHAGVRPNDMILAVSGQQVSNPNEFANAITQVPQGSAIDLAVSRNLRIAPGGQQTAPQAVTADPAPTVISPAPAPQYNQQPARRGLLRRGR